jgi:hypothetical protein
LRRDHLNALAFTHLATTLADHGALGSRHEVKPHLTLTMDLTDVLAGPGGSLRLPGHEEPVLLPSAVIERFICDAEITAALTHAAEAQATAAATARTLMQAAMQPAVRDAAVNATGIDRDRDREPDTEPDTEPAQHPATPDLATLLREKSRGVLWLGDSVRTASKKQRIALDVRDKHCAFPECQVDPSRCQAHHVIHWQHGGATDLDNLVLLCHQHHQGLHEGAWTVRPTPARDGETIHPGQPQYWPFTPPARRD